MKRTNDIPGLLFRDCYMDLEGYDHGWHSSDYSVRSNFYETYRNHIAAKQIVAGCAKLYILENYKRVKDWSNLELIIDEGDTVFDYYNFKERSRRSIKGNSEEKTALDRIMDDINAKNQIRHNPVTSFEDVVLDFSDSDFSVTINGTQHIRLSDDEVIVIAGYVEDQLKDPSKANFPKHLLEGFGWKLKTGAEQKFGSVADIYLEHNEREGETYCMIIDDGNIELSDALFHVYVGAPADNRKIFEGRIENMQEYYCMLKMIGFSKKEK